MNLKLCHHLTISCLIIFVLLNCNTRSSAQGYFKGGFMPYSTISFGVGSATYFGDLAPYSHPLKSLVTLPRWNVGLGYTRQLTPVLAVRAMITWARITGDDYTYSKGDPTRFALQYVRNLHVRNDVKELALTGVYNLIADARTPNRRARFTPYLVGGLALIAHNPEAETPTATNGNNGLFDARQWVKLQPLHTEGQGQPGYQKPYSRVTLAIPVGSGVRYKLTQTLNAGLEIGFRYTFTDHLDDVGGSYAKTDAVSGLGALLADRRFEHDAARVNADRYATAQQLFQNDPTLFTSTARVSTKFPDDGYLLTTFSIQYITPTLIKCPPLR